MSNKIHPRGFWQSENINYYYDESFSKTLNSIVSNYNSLILRKSCTTCYWFNDTIMVFNL